MEKSPQIEYKCIYEAIDPDKNSGIFDCRLYSVKQYNRFGKKVYCLENHTFSIQEWRFEYDAEGNFIKTEHRDLAEPYFKPDIDYNKPLSPEEELDRHYNTGHYFSTEKTPEGKEIKVETIRTYYPGGDIQTITKKYNDQDKVMHYICKRLHYSYGDYRKPTNNKELISEYTRELIGEKFDEYGNWLICKCIETTIQREKGVEQSRDVCTRFFCRELVYFED
jgi:hypothetical protein